MTDLNSKYNHLKNIILDYKTVLVAYSGGVDSTFLAKVAYDTLKDNAIAVTIRSAMNPKHELYEAREFINQIGIKHLEIDADEFNNKDFIKNDKDRCYYCKKELFKKLKNLASQKNLNFVIEGSNIDDTSDYRPGLKAISELGIKSPLIQSNFTKSEIRALSKNLNLPTWDKPSFACLASRIPYGTQISYDILKMIEEAELYLINLGFKQLRVRYHNNLARIELLQQDIKKIFENGLQNQIYDKFKQIGFIYVTIDIIGYKTGSMNIF